MWVNFRFDDNLTKIYFYIQTEIKLLRNRRDFDFEVGANHDQTGGTEITAETIANLWKSKDGKTLIDGSATYSQRFGGFDQGNGNANYGGKLKLKRIYNLK